MKAFKRILAFVLTLIMITGIVPVVATAQDDIVSASALVNLFDSNASSDINANATIAGIVQASGVPRESTGHYTSAFISVSAGDTVYFGPANPSQGFHLHGFSAAENTAISDSTVAGDRLTVVDEIGPYVIYAYTVPTGVSYVRVANAAGLNKIFTITVNQKFDATTFTEYWSATPERKEAMASVGTYFTPRTDSVLYQKSALFVGDSICAATQDAGLFYRGWAGRIGTVNDMDYVNGGVSGASCSTTRENNRIVTQLLKNSNRTFDYVILHGGVNDAWDSREVGTVSAGFDLEDFDTYTFAGGLEEMIFHAQKCYPTAKIGYIMNFAAPNCTKGTVSNMDAYFARAKQICDKWGIPYLNLYENDDFCNNVLKVTETTYLPDNIHPNAQGYDLLYPVIEAWMETLAPLAENLAGSSVIELSSEADLLKMAENKMLTADYRLVNDIELTTAWTPVTIFEGTFDGQGHTISGLSLTNCASVNWGTSGFFGQALNAEIKNLTLKGEVTNDISGVSVQLAAFAGDLRNTLVENCTSYVNISTGTSSASIYAGAIAGVSHYGSVIKNCENYGSFVIRNQSTKALCYIGGLVGYSNHSITIDSSVNHATIDALLSSGHYAFVGGILGYSAYKGNGGTTFITNCINAGDLKVKGIAAGMLAYSNQEELIITDCKNTANISSANKSAGILGEVTTGTTYKDIVIKNCANIGITADISISAQSHAAGIFAHVNAKNVGAEIIGCFNNANITSNGNYAGGILAQYTNGGAAYARPLSISYCTNLGRIEALGTAVFLGGIVARVQHATAASSIHHNYNAGAISAPNNSTGYPGAIAGSEGAYHYDYNITTVAPIFGYGKSASSQTGSRVLTAGEDLAAVVELLNTDKPADVNGFRYHEGAIEPIYWLNKTPVTLIGTQITSVDPIENTYAIRFISTIESIDYDAAGYYISASITTASGTQAVPEADYRMWEVYKSLNAAGELGKVDAPVGTYFLAATMVNIPADAVVTFTVTPYTLTGSTAQRGEATVMTIENGVLLASN